MEPPRWLRSPLHSCSRHLRGANSSPALDGAAPAHRLVLADGLRPGRTGGFLHWRIARLPASARSLPAGSRLGGLNSAGTPGWTGPCPPPGPAHHYRFTLRALDRAGKVLAVARLVAFYRRA
jgi:phosphatidylethanolamine-binding protein (PEBP) family uncharacterized protein